MVRSNGHKQRGVQTRGVGKRKGVRGSRTHSSIFMAKNVQQLLKKVADKCFNILTTIVCAIYSAPLHKTGHNQLAVLEGKQKFIFYAVSVFAAGCIAHKVKAFVDLLNQGSAFDFKTFLSFVTLLYYFVPYATAVGVLMKPKETMELIHDWPNLLSCMEEATDSQLTPFTDFTAAIKALLCAGGIAFAFIGELGTYLLDDTLSFYFHPQFKDYFSGLYSLIPELVWKMVFLPIDVFSICIALPLIGFVGMTLSMEFGTLKSFLKDLSTIPVNAKSHAKVHHLYTCFRIHNTLSAEWFKLLVCPLIFSQSSTIVICLYMAIKHAEMPVVLLACFLGTSLVLLAILFWSGLDMIAITKGGEGIIQSLLELKHMDFMKLTKVERREYVKRAAAIRKPSFPVGNFTELDFDVLTAIWDEIINQLLFLLTY